MINTRVIIKIKKKKKALPLYFNRGEGGGKIEGRKEEGFGKVFSQKK